jgi:uncharacterized cupin superfamily protein
MLEGEIALEIDGSAAVLTHGDVLDLPPGASYLWTVVSEQARVLIIADHERGHFYRELSRPADAGNTISEPANRESLAQAAAANGLELLAPKLAGS